MQNRVIHLLVTIIFSITWTLFAIILAHVFPKANGQPFDEMGMVAAIMPAFLITIFVVKKLRRI